jgi:D-beta-D-heptose 7-phosphate kinase/D-beta-D-heptose 1-phosphate adenosyltransferase
MNIVLVTGGFDPLHTGHISYLKSAKELGDKLVVGVNSDAWLTRKKGAPFMPFYERLNIVKNITGVDYVIEFNDDDDSANSAIKLVKQTFPNSKIIFANGGDRTKENIPEINLDNKDIEFIFGVGGWNKLNSSSKILQEFKESKTIRPWGNYRVLYDVPGMKVKELVIEPGKSMSMQKHFHRSEYWQICEGECNLEKESGITQLTKHQSIKIPPQVWHRVFNPYSNPCKIIEIQFGELCSETDIERK